MTKQAIKIGLNDNIDAIDPDVVMSKMSSFELRYLLNKNSGMQK